MNIDMTLTLLQGYLNWLRPNLNYMIDKHVVSALLLSYYLFLGNWSLTPIHLQFVNVSVYRHMHVRLPTYSLTTWNLCLCIIHKIVSLFVYAFAH